MVRKNRAVPILAATLTLSPMLLYIGPNLDNGGGP